MSRKKESKIHSFIKEHFMIVIMLAIMLIPSIYTVLFLGSMWDPYGNTGNLPVAVVNQDKAIVYENKELNIGQQLCDNLAKNDALQFNFVDEDVALKGLENGTFYMVMVIPANFSANSTTLSSQNPQKMEITYYTNPGTNYIASKFGESAIKTIKEGLNKQVINTYATTVYSKLGTIADGFNEAADGSYQIYNGVGKLKNGNGQITDGLDTLSNGCLTLKDGTGTLKTGLKTYTGGVSQVHSGVKQVSDGLNLLDDGAKQLDAGVGTLQEGVGTLKDGTSQLTENNESINNGAGQILDGLNTMSSQLGQSLTEENLADIERLEEGLLQLKDVVDTIGNVKKSADNLITPKAIEEMQKTLETVNNFVNSESFDRIYEIVNTDMVDWNEIISTINKIERLPIDSSTRKILEGLKAYAEEMLKIQEFEKKFSKEDVQNLVATANNLVQNYNQINSNINELIGQGSYALEMGSSTLKTLTGGLLSVQNGLDRTVEKDGETGLIEGMTTLKAGLEAYTAGVSQVDGGVDKLSAGSVQLKSGTAALTDGVNRLMNGTDKIKSGTKELVSNNKKLNDGAKQLYDGAGKLYDGSLKLYNGSLQIDDGCDKLMRGATTLEVSLRGGAKQIEETNTGDDSADMFSQPVDATEVFQRNINSNGEAMSAYMMCAGLWVACLAFCLMFSPFKTSLKNRKTFINHGFISMFVAVVSPIIMVGLIMGIDGMRPAHVLQTFLMAILTSVTFMSIVYFLNTLLDSIGSFLLLIFLCMNLSGSAGTYPINLSPKFYQIIHNFMPFTYGVDAFRSTISTGNSLSKDILVFASITVCCVTLTCVTYAVRQRKLKRKLAQETLESYSEELSYYNHPEVV